MTHIHSEKSIEHYVAQFEMSDYLNEHLLECLRLFQFPVYSNVYIECDEQNFLYFLVEGQVQCNHYHQNGKLAVIAVSNPFTAIGDIEILTEERVNSNVIATKNTIMLGISRTDVHRYGAEDPKFLRFLVEQLRQKLYETDRLQSYQVLPVIKRLTVYMLAQAQKSGQENITLPDKEGLASLLGTTVRHLNRVIKDLVEADYISSGYPHVHILNRSGLENIEV